MSSRYGRLARGALVALTAALLAVPGPAFAARGGGGGGGGGGVGGGGGETASNSLSVPAIFIDGNPFSLTCDGTSVPPSGTPLTGYSVPGYYYVQGTHTWRAGCLTAETATAVAGWGDNLTGDARLKVGSPIRVEMGLDAGNQGLPGYDVIKLEPSMLDRLSPYGTLANPVGTGFEPNTVNPYLETRVWTAGAWLKIYPVGSPDTPVVNEAARAEINATGRVVYGYNLRVAAAGQYVIEFTAPHVTVTAADAGTWVAVDDGSIMSLTITVGGGGGGGGGGGPRR